MKLITHNMLSSSFLKGVTTGFPLALEVPQTSAEAEPVKVIQSDFNEDFVKRLLLKLDYSILRGALLQLPVSADVKSSLPDSLPDGWESDTDILRKVHHAALEIDVLEGNLVCPETGRKFPIKKGIPNMMASADELK